MRLHSIELINYRSHKHTNITDLKNLVSFIGPNDAGKSTVWLACELVLTHDPTFPEVDIYRDNQTGVREKNASITIGLETPNGIRYITRSREGKTSKLILRWEDGRHETFTTLKDPELGTMVAEFTGFHRIRLDISDKAGECIQLVPLEETTPFLIMGNNDATVLRKINTLTSGARIERAKIELEKEARSTESDRKTANALLTEAETTLAELKNPLWFEVEDIAQRAEKVSLKLNALAQYTANVKQGAELYKNLPRMPLDSLVAAFDQVQTVIDTLGKFKALYALPDLQERIKEQSANVKRLFDQEFQLSKDQDRIEMELGVIKSLLVTKSCEACGGPVCAISKPLTFWHHPESSCAFIEYHGDSPDDGLTQEITYEEFCELEKQYV